MKKNYLFIFPILLQDRLQKIKLRTETTAFFALRMLSDETVEAYMKLIFHILSLGKMLVKVFFKLKRSLNA